MAGHSKWANIKHRKAAQDKKRSKAFTRIIKEITIASRDGGSDVETNPALRLAIQNAKGVNMPKDNMERAIKKGEGGEGNDLVPVNYEGYAQYGVAVFVETMTDNLNRTVANVRAIFNKFNGTLGKNGSLSFIFDHKGVFTIDTELIVGKDIEELELELIDGGVEKIELLENGDLLIYTALSDFGNMQKQLESMNLEAKSSELQRIPTTSKELTAEQVTNVFKMLDKFEDDEDVTNVFHNMELTDEVLAELEKE